mgnify:FL=1|jgi:hypothetical protein
MVQKSVWLEDDRIILRQSWLGSLAMCPERARQDMLGISKSTESTSTMVGSAVHHGIEMCLQSFIDTGEHTSRDQTIADSLSYWNDNGHEIVRWNHKNEEECLEIIELNSAVWWDEVRSDLFPRSVEHKFEIPLVVDHKPEIWLHGTIDLLQHHPAPIVDWKNPGRKPHDDWEKKRWSVQAAAYTFAVASMIDGGINEPMQFEFVHLVKGKVYKNLVECGPADWASLVALARSAGTLITADLPVWPLQMSGWHCSPKWCGAWSTCRGRFAGPDPFKQL